MDKFIISLPRNKSSKTKNIGSGVSVFNRTQESTTSKLQKKFGKPAVLKQSFLDLGQQSFGATSSCAKCGMFYVVGDVDDETRHKLYCKRAEEAPSLLNLKGLHVIEENIEDGFDASAIVEMRWTEKHKLDQEPFKTIMNMVQGELGSTLPLLEDRSESVLFYIRGLKVVGCLVREAVSYAKLVRLSQTRTTVDVDVLIDSNTASQSVELKLMDEPPRKKTKNDENNNCVVNQNPRIDDINRRSNPRDNKKKNDSKALGSEHIADKISSDDVNLEEETCRPSGDTLGIKLIWVHTKCRRSGIGCRILDVARRTFEFGRIIRKEHTAYSQPTESGLQLFLSYTKNTNIWGYC